MIRALWPFVVPIASATIVIAAMAAHGWERDVHTVLRSYVASEVMTAAFRAGELLPYASRRTVSTALVSHGNQLGKASFLSLGVADKHLQARGLRTITHTDPAGPVDRGLFVVTRLSRSIGMGTKLAFGTQPVLAAIVIG